ncbi:MAG: hypothetical protein ACOCRX_08315 [Candidatus Woesearchaeota archaeon]
MDYIKFMINRNKKNKFLWLLLSIILISYFVLVYFYIRAFPATGIDSFNYIFDFYFSITLMGYIIYPVKMIRQYREGFLIDSILSGYKRNEIYIFNFLEYLTICIIFTIGIPIIAIGYPSILNGFGMELSFMVFRNFGFFFINLLLVTITFCSAYYFFAFTVRNITIYLIFVISFNGFINELIHARDGLLYEIRKYIGIIDLPEIFKFQFSYGIFMDIILSSIIIISFFLILGYLIFRKRELK